MAMSLLNNPLSLCGNVKIGMKHNATTKRTPNTAVAVDILIAEIIKKNMSRHIKKGH